ncbi:UBP-type zinc finger domain-containing protein [Streptococcus pyogenes]|uniref:UBP-type zinc finger domain-containing protein n=1 Tax=Streptococcus pyogenes TaxID=1314 RepID=UPI003DA067E5
MRRLRGKFAATALPEGTATLGHGVRSLVAGYVAGCEECMRTGGRWVHLRRCLVCGHVGCCNSSEGRHATRHYRETGHALVQSAEPGESWRWSYPGSHFV